MTDAASDGAPDTASDSAEVSATVELRSRVRNGRLALVVLSGIYLTLLLLQAYFAGLFLMADVEYRVAHQALGWSLTYFPFLMLVAAAFSKPQRVFWVIFAIGLVLVFVQPFLVLLPIAEYGWVRAVHILNGVALVLLAHAQLRIALHLRREATS